MKNYKFTIRGHQYDVEIKEFENNIAEIEVNGTHYSVEVHKEIQEVTIPKIVRTKIHTTKEESEIKKKESAVFKVTAPLPGNILQVLVKGGDSVNAGDKLLVMEAMKMENEILAEKEGTIKDIKVAPGDAVLEGDVLIEIE